MADIDEEVADVKSASSRRRARVACVCCRSRKIRCDVVQRSPCTNCRLDSQICRVKPRPTKYRVAQAPVNTNAIHSESTPISTSQDVTKGPRADRNNASQRPRADGSKISQGPKADGGDVSYSHFPTDNMSNSSEAHSVSNLNFNTPGGNNSSDHSTEENESLNHLQLPAGSFSEDTDIILEVIDTPEVIDQEARFTIDSHVMLSYYPFLELDILPHVSAQDVNFLEQSGCFRVPTRPALDEFVKEYFLHVHPTLPMLDEGEFWESYMHRGNFPPDRPRISLFVFQAMLFSSCSFVSLETVRGLGFSSLRSARGAYYRRAKLLFDFNGENDPLVSAQGTLLLAYNSAMKNQDRINTINTFWLTTSIQSARDAGAHKYDTASTLTPDRRNALKRLWWCCIVRDRILPMGVRRPLHIGPADFNFNLAPMTKDDFENEVTRSRVYDPSTKRSLAGIFVVLCDLAVVFTEVIMVVYPLNEYSDMGVENTIDQVSMCKFGLNTWFEKTTVSFPTPAGLGEVHESVILYTNLMYMYYHSAIIALYNHEVFVLATRAKQESHWDHMCQSRRQLEEGTAGMTENLKELIQLKLSKYMPISIVAYAALPLILHILDVKLASTSSQAARKRGRLNIYGEAMRALKMKYDGTDEVHGFIGRMVDYIRLETPDPTSRSPFPGDNDPQKQHIPTTWVKAGSTTTPVNEWSDVLLRQPKLYSRLILTIDLSLAKGKFPDDADFPVSLQTMSLFGTRFPLYRIIMGANRGLLMDSAGETRVPSQTKQQHGPPGSGMGSNVGHFHNQSQHGKMQGGFHTPTDYGPQVAYAAQAQAQMQMVQGGIGNGNMDVRGAEFEIPMHLGMFDIGVQDGTQDMMDGGSASIWSEGIGSEFI